MKAKTRKQLDAEGPLARTIREIERGPVCSKCGRPNRRGDHECSKK